MDFNTSSSYEDNISLKLRSRDIHNARETSQKLENENRRMEVRLHELKLAMNLEKEEREQQSGSGYWRTGQVGTLSSYGKEAMHKAAIKQNNREKSKKKVKVLRDEPVALPGRQEGPGTMARIAKGSAGQSSGKENRFKGPACGQCELKGAHVSCMECGEDYCANCFASFHLKGALKKHRSVPVRSIAMRMPRGTPRVTNSEPSSDAYQAVHQGAEETHPMKVTLSEIDFEFAKQEAMRGNLSLSQEQPIKGSSLMDGDYNEAENAAAFQDALKAWRSDPVPKDEEENPVSSRAVNADFGVNTTGMEAGMVPLDIRFKGSLTYAEKLMLKRHRRTQLVALPDELMQGPLTGQQYDMDDNLFPDENERVDFHSMYVAMATPRESSSPSEDENREEFRADSCISIVEVPHQSQSAKRRNRKIEECSKYQVTEVEDESQPSSSAQSPSPGLPSCREAFATPAPKSARKTKKSTKVDDTERPSFAAFEDPPKTTQRPKSAKSRPGSSMKSRPNSRAGGRPESRAKSRTEVRLALFGPGVLTKEPSTSLHQVAALAPVTDAPVYEPYSKGLSDFFTAGLPTDVLPERQCSARPKTDDTPKWAVSNKLYKMAPRSWRPASSVGDCVSEKETREHVEQSAHLDHALDVNNDIAQEYEEFGQGDFLERQCGSATPVNMVPVASAMGPTPRSARPISRGDRESTLIVVDGEDVSVYTEEEEREEQDENDAHTINQLQSEMTSRTDNGTASQMSVWESCDLEMDENLSDGGDAPTPGSTPPPHFDIDRKLTESILMDDFEEMEAKFLAEDAAGVQALS